MLASACSLQAARIACGFARLQPHPGHPQLKTVSSCCALCRQAKGADQFLLFCRPTSSPTKSSLSALLAASPRDSLLSSTLGKKRMLSAQSSPSPAAAGSTPGNSLGFSGFQGSGDIGSSGGGGGHASSSALTSSLTGGLRCSLLPPHMAYSPCSNGKPGASPRLPWQVAIRNAPIRTSTALLCTSAFRHDQHTNACQFSRYTRPDSSSCAPAAVRRCTRSPCRGWRSPTRAAAARRCRRSAAPRPCRARPARRCRCRVASSPSSRTMSPPAWSLRCVTLASCRPAFQQASAPRH